MERLGPFYIEPDDGGLVILTREGLRRLTAQTLVEAIGVETLQGPPGTPGIPGPGLSAGGTPGQLAVKASSTDYDTGWVDLPVDTVAGTAAMRTLGNGARQATAGNDTRLSDTRTPTDRSVTAAKLADALKPSGSAAATDEALRRIGTGSSEAAAGTLGLGAAGSANNPHTSSSASRNTALTANWWQCSATPTNWRTGDFWLRTA